MPAKSKHLLVLASATLAVVGLGTAGAISQAEKNDTKTPPRRAPSVLERGIIAIGANAWAGTMPAALSRMTDFAVFHAPEPGPDEVARQAYEAGDPSSESFVYQNFGFACEIETWTTCGFTTSEARRRGFLARYDGSEVVLEGVRRAIDGGKPGYGVAVADAFADRMAALWPRPDGVFVDDVNVVDSRLPRGGVPDGYSRVTYRAALKAQLEAAIKTLEAAGFRTIANVGGVDSGELGLSGVAEFTFLEFCGAWRDSVRARRIASAIKLARSRGRRSICHSFGPQPPRRNLGADVVTVSDGQDYRAPFPTFTATAPR